MLSQAVLLAALLAAPLAGVAPTEVKCPPNSYVCYVDIDDPGEPGDPGSPDEPGQPGDERHCYISSTGEEVPCYDPDLGWYSQEDNCYWQLVNPQPEDGPVWLGHYPDGAIYAMNCFFEGPGSKTGWAWRADPPPGYGGDGPTPAELAQRAIRQMVLRGPDIRMTIEGDELAIVGVPVWLWTETGPTTWGPTSVTA